ncbi:MAG TPA: TonB-dependent receptor [Longimicrobiaceae bacterium]
MGRGLRRSALGRLGRLLLACLALPIAASAQTAPGPGTLTGRVVDAGTLGPLPGSLVRLQPRDSAGLARTRGAAVLADSTGEYRFDGILPGLYRIRITRLGYVPTTLEIDLRAASTTRVSMGLEVAPVRLAPLRVAGRSLPPFLRATLPPDSGMRTVGLLARLRRPEYVLLDMRSLTQADVVEAVTLAETDLFRALQRTPGVTTRDDFTATMWTRGASWDQTRVYFDGMPLFNPTHAGWLFSAVNPEAVGEAVFYPGARPARFGEGTAAVLDLRARGGDASGGVKGRGELSLASARLALDGGRRDGAFNWMVAGRRTYVDLVTRMAGAATADDRLYVPYDFSDLIARVDGRLGTGWEYAASGIVERDRLRGDIPGILQGNHGRWGNASGQMSVGVPLGPLQARIGAGQTRFSASVLRDERARLQGDDPTLPPLESLIHHGAVSLEVAPVPGGGLPPNWSVGFQAVHDSVGYEGPFSLLGELAVVLPRDSTPLNTLTLGSGLRYRAIWGEHRIALGPLTLETGLRAEVGDSVMNGGEIRVAPRLAGSLQLGRDSRVSAGWSRAWQYTQDIAPVAGPLGPQLHLTHLWILAQRSGYGAIRSDVATAGIEQWLSDQWVLGLNLYRRVGTGVEVPNPDSGLVVPDRDPSVQADNRARGMELSARKLGGRWSASAGYSFGVSRMFAEIAEVDTTAFEFPNSADVRHALDATLLVEASRGLRVGGAFTYGSGVPYTRLILPDPADESGEVRLGEANAMRTPSYASLDLVAELTRTLGDWEMTGYVQLRNALDRDNRVTYSGSHACVAPGAVASEARPGCHDGVADRFEAGIPRLPLIGVRFTF